MAIEFTGVNGQGISFPSIAAINNLATKTICFNVNIDAYSQFNEPIDKYDFDSDSGWWIDFSTAGTIYYFHRFSSSNAGWYIGTSVPVSSWHHLAVSYNNSDTANNPVFYVDGSVVVNTEDVAPSGTAKLESANFEIGYDASFADTTFNGKLQDVRLYSRIISATEVEILAKSRCQNVVLNGLVFWAPLNGAAGISSFDGATLGASNYVRDVISGAIGTPVGNPLGAGNTIQRIR